MAENYIFVTIGDHKLKINLTNNSSAAALKDLVKTPKTVHMRDFSNFEKVGSLGVKLPTNDEDISTGPGDVILYQGNNIVIYYDHNSWCFTRLGKIDISQAELKAILGRGDVTATFSQS